MYVHVIFDVRTCRCREVAAKFMSERNGDSQHVLHVMGHCHIDSGMVPHCAQCVREHSHAMDLIDSLIA